jgi:hypothetical protein
MEDIVGERLSYKYMLNGRDGSKKVFGCPYAG